MELRRYLQILRRKLPLVLACVAVGILAAYLATPRTVRYTATATLYVGSRVVNPDQRAGELSNDRTLANQFVQTYAEIIRTEASAADAISRTRVVVSPAALVAATEATPVANTTLFEVSVTHPDPGTAQTLANALATSFVSRQAELERASTRPLSPDGATDTTAGGDDPASAGGTDIGGIPVSVTNPAKLPTVPESNGLTRNLFLGALFGLAIAIAIVGLLEYLDVTIKTPAEAERRLELPVLGALPLHPGRQPGMSAARLNGATAAARTRA